MPANGKPITAMTIRIMRTTGRGVVDLSIAAMILDTP
jgi:hypothetical protein